MTAPYLEFSAMRPETPDRLEKVKFSSTIKRFSKWTSKFARTPPHLLYESQHTHPGGQPLQNLSW